MGFKVICLLSLFGRCKTFRGGYCHHYQYKIDQSSTVSTMVVQQLVSTKIPPDWVDHLDKLVVAKNLSRSALVKVAIGRYLGLSEVDPAIVTVDLRSELDDIRSRLDALERSTKPSTISSTNVSTPSSTDVSTKPIAPKSKTSTPKPTASTPPIAAAATTTSPKSPPPPNGKPLADGYQWLITNEAYELARTRGCEKPTKTAFSKFAQRHPDRLDVWGLRYLGRNLPGDQRTASFQDLRFEG